MTALAVSGLSKSFGGLRVTRDVNLSLEPGTRHLIIGPNGAGKTTLFNIIMGEIRPDSGTIMLGGRDVTREPGWLRARRGMARTYQIITLFHQDTIIHNLTLALLALSWRRWNPLTALDGEPGLIDRAKLALARVGLEHLAGRRLPETSYGERRRVEIAMALAQDPKVLLLDEPFAGLSAAERKDLRHLLDRIPRTVTVLMIEHDMDIALEFAEQMTLLNFGEVVVQGNREEVLADPRTREVYLGS
jgi:branched-chain amino acid transport system ATP-binding protein